MQLECPYCKNGLRKGFIEAWKAHLKWKYENTNLFEKYTELGGEFLNNSSRISGYRCKNCNKIIIDLDEL